MFTLTVLLSPSINLKTLDIHCLYSLLSPPPHWALGFVSGSRRLPIYPLNCAHLSWEFQAQFSFRPERYFFRVLAKM